MFASSRTVVLVSAALLTLLASASASSPGTSYIFPAGAQRGTTVKVIVGGYYLFESCPWEMSGPGITVSKTLKLAERQVWFEGPRIPMPDSQRSENYPKDQLGTVTVAKTARPGHRYYQAWTSEGVTAGLGGRAPAGRRVGGRGESSLEVHVDDRVPIVF